MNSREMGWHIKKIVLAHLASLFLDKGNLYTSHLYMWTINNSIEFENQEFFIRKLLERPQEKIFLNISKIYVLDRFLPNLHRICI
jgi:zinc transporter ZupT